MTTETSSVLEALGIDPEEVRWQDFATCRGMNTNWWYDEYDDETVSHIVDEACLSCPVMKQCAAFAVENSEWGCWAGVYFVSGKPDVNKNKYKSKETWDRIKARLSNDD